MSDDGSDELDVDEIAEKVADRIDEEDLEPMEPERALELWFNQLDDPSESTIQSYTYRLNHFQRFLEKEGIEDLNELSPRLIKEFEAERRAELDNKSTLNTQLGTTRQFLAYCYELDAIDSDTFEAMNVPTLSKDDRVNTEKLISNRAETILENLDRYRRASAEHVIFTLLWRTGARLGAIHSLDLEDVYFAEGERIHLAQNDRERLRNQLQSEGIHPEVVDELLDDIDLPVIWFRHRPETDTPLKNQTQGERVVNIREETAELLKEYIKVKRPDIRDDHGRQPLLTTRKGKGRRSKSNIRNWIYILTQPCEFGGPCPHDRDPETCEAREHGMGSKCPSSRSPHKLRTGAITDHRDRGWSVADLAERANAGERLIQSVYDQPNELMRATARRVNLDKDRDSDQ